MKHVVDWAHIRNNRLRVAGEVSVSSRREEQMEEEEEEEGASLELSLGPVIHFLQSALKNREEGDSRHYKLLVQQIACKRDQDTLLRVYLGLAQCVELLCERPESYKELILVLFRFDWDQPRPIVNAYHKLLSQLVSANSTYVLPVLHSIVRVLVPEDGGKVDAYERVQSYAHRSLSAVLSLAPSGISKLFFILSKQYPHKRLPPVVQEGYCRQLVSVAAYVPALEPRLLRLIVQRALEIDVEIKITDEGDAVRDTTAGDGIFDMDDVLHGPAREASMTENVDEMAQKLDCIMLVLFEYLKVNVGCGVVADDEHEASPSVLCNGVPKNPKDVAVAPMSSSPFPMSSVDKQKRLCEALLGVFEDSILLTHQSKYVQYVIFYAGGLSPPFCQGFVNSLLKICFNEEQSVVVRQSGVAYLASYLARAAYVENHVLSSALTSVLGWIMQHISKYNVTDDLSGDKNEDNMSTSTSSYSPTPLNGSRTGMQQHLLFYSFCQAAFYIMCFHMDKLCDHARLHMREWTRILGSPLNPLRHCLSTIRWEFARLCEVYLRKDLPEDLMKLLRPASSEGVKVSNVIAKPSFGRFNSEKGGAMNFAARNRYQYRRTYSFHVGGGGGSIRSSLEANTLDSFFPFDPYLLKRSHIYLEGLYCYWSTRRIAPGGFKKSDDDLEEEEDEVDNDSDSSSDSSEESDLNENEEENGCVVEHTDNDEADSNSNVRLVSSLVEGMSLTPGSGILSDENFSAFSNLYSSSLNDDHEFHRSVVASSAMHMEKKQSQQPATSYTSVEDDGW